MQIAIHQPNFIPYPGYFCKMLASDQFVIYDDVQYPKGGYVNRNRIKGPNGVQWVTIPVRTKGQANQLILDVDICEEMKWKKKLLSSVRQGYSNSPFFRDSWHQFEAIIETHRGKLIELNLALIAWVREKLEIDSPIIRSSTIDGIDGCATERLIDICKTLGADAYCSGKGGNNYQDANLFANAEIRLSQIQSKPIVYDQIWGDFESDLSILDLVFNAGPKCRDILTDSILGNDEKVAGL